jgi:hypothetical protein
MGKADKRLLALATALIITAIGWFVQFSQAQQKAIYTDSIVQILDATQTAHTEVTNDRPEPTVTVKIHTAFDT